MRLAVLGATGHTGRELTRLALDHGHEVVALARNPSRIELSHPNLAVASTDVYNAQGLARAVYGVDVLLSGLGIGRSDAPGTLSQGAQAAVMSDVPRIVWLGALGTGASRRVAGPLLGPLLGLALRSQIPDKVRADTQIVTAGHTVVHAGRLTGKSGSGGYRLVPAAHSSRQWFPPSVSRAVVATLMLAEAEEPRHRGETVVVLRE